MRPLTVRSPKLKREPHSCDRCTRTPAGHLLLRCARCAGRRIAAA